MLRNQLSMTSVELREEVAQRAIDRFTRHFASDAVIQALRYEALQWRFNDWMCRNVLSADGRQLNKSSSQYCMVSFTWTSCVEVFQGN